MEFASGVQSELRSLVIKVITDNWMGGTWVTGGNGSPATHQTLRQQGGTGEDSYIHLADWTLSVAVIEKKKKKRKKKKTGGTFTSDFWCWQHKSQTSWRSRVCIVGWDSYPSK